jgi:hypothetical protein
MSRTQTAMNAPIDKVAYSIYVGSSVAIGVWLLKTYAHIDVPPEIASAVTVLLSGFIGYITPIRANEVKSQA